MEDLSRAVTRHIVKIACVCQRNPSIANEVRIWGSGGDAVGGSRYMSENAPSLAS